MLYVLHNLKKRISDIKLLFVGKDWGEKEKLIRLANSLGILKNIKFVGEVSNEEIINYLSKADIFLLSSEYEGFGISVVEAMASGLPVVVNDIPTMREIINNGENGFIVEFKDYKKVSELIEKLLMSKTLLVKIGEKAKLSTRVYDWKNIVTKLEKIYSNFYQSV
jgi:glycosyltransferase involved in cell wall biosynthesis